MLFGGDTSVRNSTLTCDASVPADLQAPDDLLTGQSVWDPEQGPDASTAEAPPRSSAAPDYQRDPTAVYDALTNANGMSCALFKPSPERAPAGAACDAKSQTAINGWLQVYKDDPSNDIALVHLGQSYYSAGDYQRAEIAYSAFLQNHLEGAQTSPAYRDPVKQVLQLRAEANQEKLRIVSEGEEDATPEERARIPQIKQHLEHAILADQAMYLALNLDAEKGQLAKMEAAYADAKGAAVEDRQGMLAHVNALGNRYLALGGVTFANPKDAAFVRSSMSALAAETFSVVARAAEADDDARIRQGAGLYQAKALLAQGEIEKAEAALRVFCEKSEGVSCAEGGEHPAFIEAQSLLKKMEEDHKVAANLVALEAIEKHLEGNKASGQTSSDHDTQVLLFGEVRKLLESGQAKGLREALQMVGSDGAEELREGARKLVMESSRPVIREEYRADDIVPSLIHLTARWPLDEGEARHVLHIARGNVKIDFRVEASFIASQLVQESCREPETIALARDVEHESVRERGVLDIAYAAYTNTTAEEFILNVFSELWLLKAAGGVAKAAELRTLWRLQETAMEGRRIVALGRAARIGTMSSLLFAKSMAHGALKNGVSETFTPKQMALTYGATLLSVTGCELGGELGSVMGPRAARGLGLVAQGGAKLSSGGRVVSWGITHAMGLGGIVAGSEASRLLPGEPQAPWAESLAQDVYSYVLYAGAQAKFMRTGASERQLHADLVATREALSAEEQVKRLGGKSAGRVQEGEVVVSQEGALVRVPKDRIPAGATVVLRAGEPLFTREQDVAWYCQLRTIAHTHEGFNGERFARLLISGRQKQANAYLKDFGLKLRVEQGKAVGIEEMSRHERMGVHAPRLPRSRMRQIFVEIVTAPALMMLGAGSGIGGGVVDEANGNGKERPVGASRETIPARARPTEISSAPEVLLTASDEGVHEFKSCSIIIRDGEVAVRAKDDRVEVFGPGHVGEAPSGAAVYLEEGDTVRIDGVFYTRIDGALRSVPESRVTDDRIVHGGSEATIYDNGDGTYTKVFRGGDVECRYRAGATGVDVPAVSRSPGGAGWLCAELRGKAGDRPDRHRARRGARPPRALPAGAPRHPGRGLAAFLHRHRGDEPHRRQP